MLPTEPLLFIGTLLFTTQILVFKDSRSHKIFKLNDYLVYPGKRKSLIIGVIRRIHPKTNR